MPTPSASIAELSPLLWLAGLFVLGFGVAWLLTDLGGLSRAAYIPILASVTGVFTVVYLNWSGTDARDFLLHHWGWGLLGAVIAGIVLGMGMVQQPREVPRQGTHLAAAIAWEGILYGVTEGLLLSVLPVLLVWQSAWLAGWRDGAAIAAGLLGLVASAAFIVVHHLGYRGFRGPEVFIVMAACSLLSAAYLLTGSVLAPIVGHTLMHIGGVLHGTQMPPYAAGHNKALALHLSKGGPSPLPPIA